MANENFTTYIEIDPADKITVTSSIISVASGVQVDSYVYKDKDVGFFNGNFEHLSEIRTGISGYCENENIVWGLNNDIDDYNGIVANSESELCVGTRNYSFSSSKTIVYLREIHNGTVYNDSYSNTSMPSIIYLKIKRDESIGTYGRLYCYVYSDLARTILLDTLQLDLHEKIDFRYVYAFQYKDGGCGHSISNLDIGIETITDTFTIISSLKKNISNAFSIISTLFLPSFKIISNLVKNIPSTFTIISSLGKEFTVSFTIISILR